MRYRLTFVSGLAVGYLLGTRAGRERYEQIRKGVRRVAENPAVRNVGEVAVLSGREAAFKAAGAVGEWLSSSVNPVNAMNPVNAVNAVNDRARAAGDRRARSSAEWGGGGDR